MKAATDVYKVGAPLPPYQKFNSALAESAAALLPHGRAPLSEISTQRKINAGGRWTNWDNSVAPYMIEPMNATQSRRFESLVFVGPARCSKTEALIINPAVHAILAAPRLVAIFHMTQSAAREFSVQDLGPIIRNTPALAKKLRLDNDHDKRFAGGARITIDWPVSNKLAGRSIPLVLMSDYDAMAQDIGGEGSPFALGRKRTTSAGSRGMNVVESSPRFPILDESWTPKSPHEAPPCEGIISLYNSGTRARLYWTCPDCGGHFEPLFERLDFPKAGTAAERGAAAVMLCLHCGVVIKPSAKTTLNAGAVWLHEGADGALVPLCDGPRSTTTLSYWLPGPAAALSSWAQLVTRYIEGVEQFRRTGDESALKSATNLDIGAPYRPRAMSADAVISEAGLRERASDHAWRVAPAAAAFLLAAVDVQKGRFVVQVMAHLPDAERVLIDRFDIIKPPAGAPRADDRQLDPSRYAEDWDALLVLLDLTYPVATAAHSLSVMATAIDAGGAAGVTPNAYNFWRARRKDYRGRFHLIRGVGGERVKRAEVRAPETAHAGRGAAARDVLIIRAGTDRLKDEVAAALLRPDAGPGSIALPTGAPADVFKELASERRGPKGWAVKPGIQRNEALDLAVYDRALFIVLGCEKINWDRPPGWALIGPKNTFARPARDPQGDPQPDVKPKRRPRRKKRFDGWV